MLNTYGTDLMPTASIRIPRMTPILVLCRSYPFNYTHDKSQSRDCCDSDIDAYDLEAHKTFPYTTQNSWQEQLLLSKATFSLSNIFWGP